MASTPLYPEFQRNLVDLLQEGAKRKQYVSTVTTNYAERLVNSPQDFSQPALYSEGCTPSLKTDECTTPSLMINDEEIVAEEDAFKNAMRLYENSADVDYRTGINPDDDHTVAQLESLVDESIKQFQINDSRGFWGKIRLACRKLGENKDAIEGWLGVLPSETQYLSVICGGLKLILKAAARLNDIREKVLESLESIPTLINNAQRVSSIYEESEKLRILSKTFYTSILAALGHILKYLKERANVRKRAIKVFKAVISPSSFDKELREKIERVEKCVSAFEAEANICQKEQIHQAKQNIDVTMTNINEVKQTMVYAAAGYQDIIEIMLGIKRRQSDLGRDVSNMKSAFMANLAEHAMNFLQSGDAVQVSADIMMRPMVNPTNSGHAMMEIMNQGREIQSTARKTGHVKPTEAIHDQLLSQLDLDQSVVGLDLTSVYNLGPKLSQDNQERSMFLIKAPKLTAWMGSERSAALIVNGNTKRIERQSGLAFVGARLAFAFEGILSSAKSSNAQWPRILPLYFFCGGHTSGDYSWETPKGVLDSILGQLLIHMKSNGLELDPAKVPSPRNANKRGIKDVIRVFRKVLGQLPANTTVFCIIDALSVYLDNSRTSHDAEQLTRQLLKLAQAKKRKSHVIFKLLLTAPKRLHSRAADGLDEESVLTLPPTLPNKGGFTATKWHYSISQQLDSL